MDKPVITKLKAGVLIITLNRPAKFNSFNPEMNQGLIAAIDEAAADKNIRAILITGAGKAFCAGQDLSASSMKMPIVASDIERSVIEHYNPIVLKLRALEKPVVCAVNGVAAGAGANLALACDIVFAAKSASFIQAFSKIGLVPDCGGSYLLPRLVGLGKAAALMMLGENVSATEAEKMGMIYKVEEDDQLMEMAMKTASRLAQAPTVALGLTKKLLNDSMNNNLEQQLAAEGLFQGKAAITNDFSEGVAAFIGKRKAEFKGE